jgi:hypothetical protein
LFAHAFTLADLGTPPQLSIYVIENMIFTSFSGTLIGARHGRAAAKFDGDAYFILNRARPNEVLAV